MINRFRCATRVPGRIAVGWSLPMVATAGIGLIAYGNSFQQIYTRSEASSSNDNNETTSKETLEKPTTGRFESSWIKGSIEGVINQAVGTVASLTSNTNDARNSAGSKPEDTDTYQNMGKMLTKLLLPSSSTTSLSDVLQEVQSMSGRGDIQDASTVVEVLDVAKRCQKMLDSKLGEFFGTDGFPPLQLQQLFYFIEREDEVKNPSWKRRRHYFFPGIDMKQMEDLNEKLKLTDLAYADTEDEVRDRLQKEYNSELVYCSLDGLPNKPAHFIAVERDQSPWNTELEVLLVVCGTKRITDVITDLLCVAEPYRDGYAHSGICESGRWIARKHVKLFEKIRLLSNKKKIKLTLLGHSLGAGAATIAGIELNGDPFIDVEVVGFGCPALLSPELSTSYEHIVTTVIGDNDCVPRMSMATMVNTLLDMAEFDYTPFALRDIEETVNELERFLPSIVDGSVKRKVLNNLNGFLPDVSPNGGDEISKRMEVVLFPPGRCIHFYSDGFGTSGSVVPCTFFDELDINRRLLHDHLIKDGYQKIFLDVMRQYKNDNHYSFNEEKK
ncbi:unnamed protein product [Pseudo-nitzschia multistriata]|uniref:Fungal lipase-type domain-containing protein n=1 Tax=Pseudo-nitzschia multistriata TaxID=183589 RepID=A0A448Z4A5_9STRA|nr:unnamed protein product [Pseudo-nitzschia multistriata]